MIDQQRIEGQLPLEVGRDDAPDEAGEPASEAGACGGAGRMFQASLSAATCVVDARSGRGERGGGPQRAIERGQRLVVARVRLVAFLFEAAEHRLERLVRIGHLAAGATAGRDAEVTRPRLGCSARRSVRIGMRPARIREPAGFDRQLHRASPSRPGSVASAIAVFISTPSAPSSIAIAASDAVPTPASTITGTRACVLDDADVVRILDAEAGADRRAERHHRRRAGFLELAADHRVVVRVRQHDEPFAATRTRVASSSATLSGKSVCSSPITSSFTQFDSPTSRPSRAVRMASSAV